MRHRKVKIAFVLVIALLTWAYTHNFGFLDTYPRVQQISESEDGMWKFEVYQRKLELLNPFADSEIVFSIKDIEGNRVHEERIWRYAWWRGFDKYRKYDVRFERDVIIVNNFWVTGKDSLKFEMCPLLECLTNSD